MQLETKRLIIRQPMICDVEKAYKLRTDKETNTYIGGVTSFDFNAYKSRYQTFCDNFDHSNPYIYSIISKESSEYIGYCGIQHCSVMEEMELLYGIHSNDWGRGYVSEAAKAVLTYVLEEFKSINLYAAVNPQNIASEKILNSIGFEFHKKIEWPKQGLVNMYRYPNRPPVV